MKLNLPSFSNTRVVVAGDIMLDTYWFGSTSRISPEAPVPVVHVGRREDRPGGAGNVAVNLASLGIDVNLIGVTGNDEAADTLENVLGGLGIICHLQRLDEFPTINKFRVISKNQQLIRIDFEESFDYEIAKALDIGFGAHVEQADAVVLSDYGKGSLTDVQDLIQFVRKRNIPVLIDPKGTDYSRYRDASLITPNLAELEAVVGPCVSENDICEKGMRLLEEISIEALLVTRSEKGMMLLRRGYDPVKLPTQAKEVFDVTGAGDTVIAVMAACIAANTDLETAARISNLAAGVVVGKLGAASVTQTELHDALEVDVETRGKITGRAQLLEETGKARHQGERLVMTNGCFDILHAGHITYLEKAKAMGSRLIVAVNSDDSVRRLKGEGRPVNTLEDRLRLLAGLECVDWVTYFDEDTPEALICEVLPDVLVKGGDYTAAEVAGHDCVTANGGRVAIVDYVEDKSTTGMLERIRKSQEP